MSFKVIDNALKLLIPTLILLHSVVAPYTKVEESFNIQATHDVLVYGMPTTDIARKLSNYDHFSFPGAVPRTFIGPVLLGGLSQPIIALVGFDRAQFTVRAILGLFNAFSLLVFTNSIARVCGSGTARWYMLLQASQFHVIFYASRTLPNMFAFGLTTLAFAYLLPGNNRKQTLPRQRVAISMFVFAAVIFRSEVALLLITNILYLLLIPATSLERVIRPFAVAFVVALALSVPIDSYFWQKPLWPELWGFYYNAVLGSSSNWGVSPWHYYFSSALPRLLLNPFTLVAVVPALRHPSSAAVAGRLVIPSLLFVAIYSLQPHKEARFIFYVVPPLTAAAALVANRVWNRRAKSFVSRVLALSLAASVIASFVASTGMLAVSALNYPGGEALAHLRGLVAADTQSSPAVSVHADVLACMTGVTLFGTAVGPGMPSPRGALSEKNLVEQQRGGRAAGVSLLLDKTEDGLTLDKKEFWTQFDYVLMEDREKVKGGRWETVAAVLGYGGVEVERPGAGGTKEAGDVEVVGHGKTVRDVKGMVRKVTGGWWAGPRMVPKIYVLRRVKEVKGMREAEA